MKKTFKGFAVGNILRNKKLDAIVARIVVFLYTLMFSLLFVTPKIANASIDTGLKGNLLGNWSTVSSPNYTPANYDEFNSAWVTSTNGSSGQVSYIKLMGDIEIPDTSTTRTLNGNYVKLDLNGHVITYTASTGSVFAIVDSNNNGGLYITDSNPNAVNTININDKDVTIQGGVITGGKGYKVTNAGENNPYNEQVCGGAIYVDNKSCVLVMDGGTLAGNTAEYGGGLFSRDGYVFIEGTARIEYNGATYGGGLSTGASGVVGFAGSPVVANNTNKGGNELNNVYVFNFNKIEVYDVLTPAASIGIAYNNTGSIQTSPSFLQDYHGGDGDINDYFISDAGYAFKLENGEVSIDTSSTATYHVYFVSDRGGSVDKSYLSVSDSYPIEKSGNTITINGNKITATPDIENRYNFGSWEIVGATDDNKTQRGTTITAHFTQDITITGVEVTAPTKSYTAFDSVAKEDITVNKVFSDGSTEVTDNYTISYAYGHSYLHAGLQTVTVTYQEGGEDYKATFTLTVAKKSTEVTWQYNGETTTSAERDFNGTGGRNLITLTYIAAENDSSADITNGVCSLTALNNRVQMTYSGGNDSSIKNSGTYTFRLGSHSDYEFTNNEFTLTVKPIEIDLSKDYYWTLNGLTDNDNLSDLRDGYVYKDADNNYLYFEQAVDTTGLTLVADNVKWSIVRYRNTEVTIRLNGGNIPTIAGTSDSRAAVNYTNNTASDMGEYTATAEIILNDKVNYVYKVSETDYTDRGMTINVADGGKSATITKKWYIAQINNGLVDPEDSTTEYGGIDGWTFGGECTAKAPVLEVGGTELITFDLYFGTGNDAKEIAKEIVYGDFGKYINNSMPANSYSLVVHVGAYTSDDGITAQSFSRTFTFTVKTAEMNVSDAIKGELYSYTYDGSMHLHSSAALSATFETTRVGIWTSDKYNALYDTAAAITYRLERWGNTHNFLTEAEMGNLASGSKPDVVETDKSFTHGGVNVYGYKVYYQLNAKNYATYGSSGHDDYYFFVEITKQEVDVTNVKFTDAAYTETYNNSNYYDTIISDLTIALGGDLSSKISVVYGISDKDGSHVNSVINAGTYTVKATITLQDAKNYSLSDGGTGAVQVVREKTITIDKAKYDLSGISFADYTITYDGQTHSITVTGELPTGLDGIKAEVVYSANSAYSSTDQFGYNQQYNVGVYTVYAYIRSNSGNYYDPYSLEGEGKYSATFTVQPDFSGLEFEKSEYEFDYDGKSHTVEISGTVPSYANVTYTYKKDGAPLDAGKVPTDAGTYTVTATLTCNGNYNDYHSAETRSATIVINKVDWDLGAYGFEQTEYTFTYEPNEVHNVKLENENGVTVTYGYTKNGSPVSSVTAAGTYTVTATITKEGDVNHNDTSKNVTATITISRKNYSVDGVNFNKTEYEFEFNNADHTSDIVVTGNYDENIVSVEIVFSKDQIINAGSYTATLKFELKDENYTLTGAEGKTVNITVKPYEVDLADNYYWTLDQYGSNLRTGWVYKDASGKYYYFNERQTDYSLTLEGSGELIRSIVRYRNTSLTIVLNNGAIPKIFNTDVDRASVVYEGCTGTNVGKYTATATITLTEAAKGNYKYVSSTTLEAGRNMVIEISQDGNQAIITKTWYIVDINNGLLDPEDSTTEYGGIDGWTFGGVCAAKAPSLEHGSADILITFTLYSGNIIQADKQIGGQFSRSEFANYINNSMPAGDYALRVSVASYTSNAGDDIGVTYQAFQRTFTFTVGNAQLSSIDDKIKGQEYAHVYDKELHLYEFPEGTYPFSNSDEVERTGIWNQEIYDSYYTAEISFRLARWGESTYLTKNDMDTASTRIVPRNAGDYKVYYRLSVKNYDIYGASDEYYFNVKITKAQVNVSGAGLSCNYNAVYDGNDKKADILDKAALNGYDAVKDLVNVAYAVTKDGSNVNTVINAGEYKVVATITLKDTANYELVDSTGENGRRETAITIEKASYDVTNLKFEDVEQTYTGEEFTIEVSGLPEGVTVSYWNADNTSSDYNAHTNANEEGYVVYAVFTVDSNHEAIGEMSAKLIIKKAAHNLSDITFAKEQYEFDYNGNAHEVTLSSNLLSGVSVVYAYSNGVDAIEGKPVDAGTYTLTATVTKAADDNHNETTATVTTTIVIKAVKYAFNGITLTGKDVVYTGNEFAVEFGELPEDVEVVGYYKADSDKLDGYDPAVANYNRQTNAGTYEIVAVLRYNAPAGSNYLTTTKAVAVTLKINKADYDFSRITFSNDEQTFNASYYELNVAGIPDNGLFTVKYYRADNSSVGGYAEDTLGYNSQKNAGTYVIYALITFAGDGNYSAATISRTATLKINKANYDFSDMGFVQSEFNFVYDGKEHSANLNNVSGLPDYVQVATTYTKDGSTVAECVNAGTYTVTVVFTCTESDNYKYTVSDPITATIVIAKANYDLSGIKMDDASFLFNGEERSIAVYGTMPEGATIVYKNEDGSIASDYNMQTNAGIYKVYAVITCAGDENHEETTRTIYATLTIKSSQIDITITGDGSKGDEVDISSENGFDPDLKIYVNILDEKDYAKYSSAVNSDNIEVIYEVVLKRGDEIVQPTSDVIIKLLIPETLSDNGFKIYQMVDGKAQEVQFTIKDGYAIIVSDTLSEFIFVKEASTLVVYIIALGVVSGLLAVALVAQVISRKKKNSKSGTSPDNTPDNSGDDAKKGEGEKKSGGVKLASVAPLFLAAAYPAGQLYGVIGLSCLALVLLVANIIYFAVGKKKSNKAEQISEQHEQKEQQATNIINVTNIYNLQNESAKQDEKPEQNGRVIDLDDESMQTLAIAETAEEVVEEEPEPEPEDEEEDDLEEEEPEEEDDNEESLPLSESDDEAFGILIGKDESVGLAIVVRYKKSFTAKLIQSSDDVKGYYTELKNEVLSYEKTRSRVSWNYDSINAGRAPFAKFVIRGKTLCMYLALDPDEYEGTKYKVVRSFAKRYAEVPCLYRIKNTRRLKYAVDLIKAAAEKAGLSAGENVGVDYYQPYDTTESLVQRELIKELVSKEDYETFMRKYSRRQVDKNRREFISAAEVNSIIDDEVAMSLIENVEDATAPKLSKSGKKGIINVDTLSANFEKNEIVNIETLKEKQLIPASVGYIKVLARGSLSKPLIVEAQDFSLEAIKMIALTGGKVKKV